jgi:hypothetical protein
MVRARRRLAIALACLAVLAAQAAELGTLFTTPEERLRLDRLRRGEPEVAQTPAQEHSRTPTLTGFVKRSDGRNTVWIDGVPMAVGRKGTEPLLQPNAVQGSSDPHSSVRVNQDSR